MSQSRRIHIAKRVLGLATVGMESRAFSFCTPDAPIKRPDTWTANPNFATCRKCKAALRALTTEFETDPPKVAA